MSRTSSSPVGREPRLRVVFMGTPDYGVPTLRGLIAAHDVVAVFTQPDRRSGRGRQIRLSPVKQVALEHEIEVFQPKSLRRDRLAVESLCRLEADAVVVAAYGLILPPQALTAARLGAINVHASLLPRWRGAAPVSYAILAGDTVTGATIMQMDPGLDTGPVLAACEVEIGPSETAGSLTRRLSQIGAELLIEVLPEIASGSLHPSTQDDSRATLAPRLKTADGLLDWRDAAHSLRLRVRAMNPWPGAFVQMPDGSRLKVHEATAVESPGTDTTDQPCGSVIALDGCPAVRARGAWLMLDEVQAPGKRAMPGADYLRGRSAILDARLPMPDTERTADRSGSAPADASCTPVAERSSTAPADASGTTPGNATDDPVQ